MDNLDLIEVMFYRKNNYILQTGRNVKLNTPASL